MRHRVRNNHLSRKSAHRKALLSHLSNDLIKNKRIVTTLAKAKALRVYVEPLITKSKTNTTHNRRIVFSRLQDKTAVAELFGDVSAKVGNRPGGYTRIIKLGTRLGDASEMALIELVDFNEVYSNTKESNKPKKKRTRRSGSRRKTTSAASEAKEAPVGEKEAATAEKTEEKEKVAEDTVEEKAGASAEAKTEKKQEKKEEKEEKVSDDKTEKPADDQEGNSEE